MEVELTSEQVALLSQIASFDGKTAARLVKEAAIRLVEQDAEFRAGVRRGMEQADRGELVEHEEIKAQIRQLIGP